MAGLRFVTSNQNTQFTLVIYFITNGYVERAVATIPPPPPSPTQTIVS